jgi:hypothetical protein
MRLARSGALWIFHKSLQLGANARQPSYKDADNLSLQPRILMAGSRPQAKTICLNRPLPQSSTPKRLRISPLAGCDFFVFSVVYGKFQKRHSL